MFAISRRSSLYGEIIVPGSKSHAIRAVLLAAMADGRSRIKNPLTGSDGKSALSAARAFGARVEEDDGVWTVYGTGGNLKVPDDVIDSGNSGTTMLFTMGMAALCEGYTVITGDDQIRRRPVSHLVSALNEIGANAFLTRPGLEAPPVIVKGRIKGGTAHFSGFNSQAVSAILMASALGEGRVDIEIKNPLEKPYLQMTIDWMRRYGVELSLNSKDYTRLSVEGNQSYTACDSVIPSDWSGVAFPLVAAVCTPSQLTVSGVDFDDAQGDKIIADHLIAMGADITKDSDGGRLIIKGGKPLKGGLTINLDDIPDSFPAFSVAACYAEDPVTFTGLSHVRIKETDRVAVMEKELTKLGAKIETTADTMRIYGGRALTGTEVESYGDHRIAMALMVAGLFADGSMKVKDAQCASVSFPTFFESMNRVGAGIELTE